MSQSVAEGSLCQDLWTTCRSGASESASEIQQSRRERDHSNVHGRNLETETLACQNKAGSLEAQVAQIPQLRGMLEDDRTSRVRCKQKSFA